jgi:hypothetical protein
MSFKVFIVFGNLNKIQMEIDGYWHKSKFYANTIFTCSVFEHMHFSKNTIWLSRSAVFYADFKCFFFVFFNKLKVNRYANFELFAITSFFHVHKTVKKYRICAVFGIKYG